PGGKALRKQLQGFAAGTRAGGPPVGVPSLVPGADEPPEKLAPAGGRKLQGPPPGATTAFAGVPGPGPGVFQLPPGTFGEIRTASGKTITLPFGYGEQDLPAPALP